jgi:hypothetical protein
MSLGTKATLILLAALVLVRLPAWAKEPDALPDYREATATGDIVWAWLIQPTDRYKHFVLGSRYEAAGVRVELRDGRRQDLILPGEAVFEDREPRLADLDGDGRNEVVLVRSTRRAGSSLVLIGWRGDKLLILAETSANGQPHRWLNPAGTGHFTASGRGEIALVRMPHLEGRLEFWSYDGRQLTLERTINGVSNHRLGSPHQRLSAVLPRKGRSDLLVIPRFGRGSLLMVDAAATQPIVGEYPLSAQVEGHLMASCREGAVIVMVPLADGSIASVEPRGEGVIC